MIDRKRDGKKLENWFRRRFLMDILTRFEREYHHRNNMVAAAQASIAARVIASGAVARRAGNACIGYVTGIRLRARYEEQEDSNDA